MPYALEQRCQVLSVDELHREKMASFDLPDVIDTAGLSHQMHRSQSQMNILFV
jgi:hypothetical protein